MPRQGKVAPDFTVEVTNAADESRGSIKRTAAVGEPDATTAATAAMPKTHSGQPDGAAIVRMHLSRARDTVAVRRRLSAMYLSSATRAGHTIRRGSAVSFASLDWRMAEKIWLRRISGEPLSLAQACGRSRDDPTHRTVVIFLKRFETQSGYVYSLIFTYLKSLLSRPDVSVVFITCHSDVSEMTYFVRCYTQWLQSNSSEGLRPLRCELYHDPNREAYMFLGFSVQIQSMNALRSSIQMNRFLARQIKAQPDSSLANVLKPASPWSLLGQYLTWKVHALVPRKTLVEMDWQIPGVCVLQNSILTYRVSHPVLSALRLGGGGWGLPVGA
nr:hypothetical protein HK105_007028 [Polyrhizophydium stewartii]